MKLVVFLVLIVAVLGATLTTKLFPLSFADNSGRRPDEIQLPAPELTGGPWINTADGKVINLANRRGKVTIVEFWTFACGNCLANLPAYANWQKQFADKDVIVIGVHTPETASERVTANVLRRVKQLSITYPILVDQEHANWNRWQVEAWPTVYLVDKQGRIRYRWVGELNCRNAGGEAKLGQFVEPFLFGGGSQMFNRVSADYLTSGSPNAAAISSVSQYSVSSCSLPPAIRQTQQ